MAIVFAQVSNQPGAVWIDNVSLKKTVDLQVGSYELIKGALLSGDLDSLRESDDERLLVRRDRPGQNVIVDSTFESPLLAPSEIRLQIESSAASRRDVDQLVKLWNVDSGEFETVGEDMIRRLTDSVVTIEITGELSRFVDPDNKQVKVRLCYDSFPKNRFTVRLDQLQMTASGQH